MWHYINIYYFLLFIYLFIYLSAECSNAVSGLGFGVFTNLCEYAQVRKDDLSTWMETRHPVSRSNSRCSRFVKEALESGSSFAF